MPKTERKTDSLSKLDVCECGHTRERHDEYGRCHGMDLGPKECGCAPPPHPTLVRAFREWIREWRNEFPELSAAETRAALKEALKDD